MKCHHLVNFNAKAKQMRRKENRKKRKRAEGSVDGWMEGS